VRLIDSAVKPFFFSKFFTWLDMPAGIEKSGTMSKVAIPEVEADLSGGCGHYRYKRFECGHCKRLVTAKLGCGKRFDYFCPECAKKWRTKTFVKYFRGVSAMSRPKFLTLTLRKNVGRVEARLMSIWEMKKYLFKQLARMGYKIPMWCGVIEPPNHIHMVIDCRYIPKHIIKDIWSRVTGDSFIVDIRQISSNDQKQIAAYIIKYLTKASKWEGINLDLLKGFHLIGSWGLPKYYSNRPLCICGVKELKTLSDEGYDVLHRWYASMWKNRPSRLLDMFGFDVPENT
jgi:REP element-mobilizing transposase RayT